LARLGPIFSHSVSVHRPTSVRLPVAFFHLLLRFSGFFDLPRPSVTFAFAQFVSPYSFLDHPSLFSTVFDNEEEIGNSDRMDDEGQIGPIYGEVILPEKS
jgi:hypothetical protein